MPDSFATVRFLDELLWRLRREGFVISTAQAVDVARAVRAVGLERGDNVREAIAAIVVHRPIDRPRYEAVFAEFFGAYRSASGDLWQRLGDRGATPEELEMLRAILERSSQANDPPLTALGDLLEGGAEFDRVLAMAGLHRSIDAHAGPQLGFLTHRFIARAGLHRARQSLALVRMQLLEAFGERGQRLADLLAAELDLRNDEVRSLARRAYEGQVENLERERSKRRLETTPFAALSTVEIAEVRKAVRAFAERLRGGARVRSRHARKGRIDPHRTLRQAMRTGGVPFAPAYKRRLRERPRLVLLCDISDSVRAAAAFLLEFTYAVHELLERARSFVFVSELGETTRLFARESVQTAIARAWGGDVIRIADNSNYGRVLRTFEERYLHQLDRRTTVVILGDGRTNYHDASPDVLDRIRERSRALLWLCPEPRGSWAQGDSAMALYAPRCTAVHDVRNAQDLERAARALVVRG